jgi:hypothetical protein
MLWKRIVVLDLVAITNPKFPTQFVMRVPSVHQICPLMACVPLMFLPIACRSSPSHKWEIPNEKRYGGISIVQRVFKHCQVIAFFWLPIAIGPESENEI